MTRTPYRERTRRYSYTHRRFEVGADATEAKTDRPGSDGPRELEKPLALVAPSSRLLSNELDARSGSAVEYCDDADEIPCAASVADWLWLSAEEEEGL